MSKTEVLDEIEVINLREYVCAGKPIPERVKFYLIEVDKDEIRVQSPIKAKEILIATDLDPCEYHLQQKLKGGKRKKLEPDDIIDLRKAGVERFESVPKEACNG